MASKTVLNNYSSFDVTLKTGKGSICTDVNGKKYIDFLAGIAVNCLGHNYPPLVKAISNQAKKQIHISNYYTSDIGEEYARALLNATGFDGVFFGNSGAEANEAAIKLARKYGYLKSGKKRRTIVSLLQSFHGRTINSLTATGQDRFHPECFGPYPEGFKYIPANDFKAIKNAFDETTAAFMVECVQCEGGVIPLDPEWVREASEAARKAGAIVIADEVQTGMGRTGSLLANEQFQFNPEVVTLAKGIAGGLPMGACLYRGIADVFQAGDHQSTFGGNPLVCAAAKVVLKEITASDFLSHVTQKGEHMRSVIKSWNLPVIEDVRGLGLITGIQVKTDPVEIEKKLLEKGLLVCTAGSDVVRLLPPLNIPLKLIDKGLNILRSVLEN